MGAQPGNASKRAWRSGRARGWPLGRARLYHVVRSRSTAACCGAPVTAADEAAATTRIDVAAHVETKLRAMRCHRSQPWPFARLAEAELRERLRWELFRLANPDAGAVSAPEADLFAGLAGANGGNA